MKRRTVNRRGLITGASAVALSSVLPSHPDAQCVTSGYNHDIPPVCGDMSWNPALDLNLTTTPLDAKIVYSRTGPGTHFNSLGVNVTESANVPRIDYDPVTLAVRGLLKEDARTNAQRNGTMAGASAPTTQPGSWFGIDALSPPINGLSATISAPGVESGLEYVDVRWQGTATSSTQFYARTDSTTSIAAVQGQDVMVSAYLRLVAGSIANLESVHGISLLAGERNSGGSNTLLTQWVALPITGASLASQRYTFYSQVAMATTAFIMPGIVFWTVSGQVYDFTLRIGRMQVELAKTASTTIQTTNAPVARGADVISVTDTGWLKSGTGYAQINGYTLDGQPFTSHLLGDGTNTNPVATLLASLSNVCISRIQYWQGPSRVSLPNAEADWAMVVLPDTQYAVSYLPAAWTALTNWIISQKAALNIKMVIGVGDVTDDAAATPMNAGAAGYAAMNTAGIPAMPAIGNHDYTAAMDLANRGDPAYEAVFTPTWFSAYPWFTDCYLGNTESWYGKITIGATTYLILVFETFPRIEVIAWAQGILNANPSNPVIIVNHSFIYIDGTLVTDGDLSSVNTYGFTGCYDGIQVWNNFAKLNPQIRMVLCGHHIGPPWSVYTRLIGNSGNTVHALFTNYQEVLTRGQPHLSVGAGARATVLQFKPSIGRIVVSVYDPALPGYTFPGVPDMVL